jgi:hypothetical protein
MAQRERAMSYRMSKQSSLGDSVVHWHPHVVIFTPLTDPAVWGASLPESPILGSETAEDRLTVFLIPVTQWSDGTPALAYDHGRCARPVVALSMPSADERASRKLSCDPVEGSGSD